MFTLLLITVLLSGCTIFEESTGSAVKNTACNAPYFEFKIGEIKKSVHDNIKYWYSPGKDESHIACPEGDLKLIELEIGDKVRILNGYNKGLTGRIATTNRSEPYRYGINLDQKTDESFGESEDWSNGNSDIGSEEDLELISRLKDGEAVTKLKRLLDL